MKLGKSISGAHRGIDGLIVRVEAAVSGGTQAFHTVGLADRTIREAKERVRSAIVSSGFDWPGGKITLNLAPASVRKHGSQLDLGLALAILAGTDQVNGQRHDRALLLGELALDGSIRPVRGVLPIVAAAEAEGLRAVVVPRENVAEAALVPGLRVCGVGSLREAIDALSATELPTSAPNRPTTSRELLADLADVKGQREARRALEIAAAGGHNLLLVGPPGAGKSLIARRLPSVLPPLRHEEALEVTKIHSVCGLLREGVLVTQLPFRSPHHTISFAAMTGGGAGLSPGEVSLAHRGVLFLDELPEFPRPALEALRQPVEEGNVWINRVHGSARFPARFMLVAAMNPCPCGYSGADERPCRCTPAMVERYRGRISGPLLDRIDLQIAVRALSADDLLTREEGEASVSVRGRVLAARAIQKRRFRKGRLNAYMSQQQIKRRCSLDAAGRAVLRSAVERLGLSARGFDRVLKVARTIADLGEEPDVRPHHLMEAVQYRLKGGELHRF